jgi:hypothetical protein
VKSQIIHQICEALYEVNRRYLYVTEIDYQGKTKSLYTLANSYEEAGQRFHQHLICQLAGPFDGPETLMARVFDKIEDGAIIS